METRQMRAECRATGTTGRSFEGTAIVYNTETLIGDLRWGFYETIAPGAVRDSILNDDIVFLADHDPAKPLARTSTDTLLLAEADDGLRVSLDEIPATTYGNDLVLNLANRNVQGMSFGFEVLADEWGTRSVPMPDGIGTMNVDTRVITQIRLFEVSTTAFPAYPTTSAAVRDALRSRRLRNPSRTMDFEAVVAVRAAAIEELREGKTLSSATLDQLTEILDLIAQADQAVDSAQPLLAGLMGVPNPDEDTQEPDEGDGDDTDGNVDPNASQEGSRHSSLFDRRLTALAAYSGLAIPA